MIKKFEFKSNVLELNIAGNIFEVDLSKDDLPNNMANISNEILEKGKDIKSSEDAKNMGYKFIDTLLGAGASDKIFDKNKSYMDCLDVIVFILSEIQDYQKSRFAPYEEYKNILKSHLHSDKCKNGRKFINR